MKAVLIAESEDTIKEYSVFLEEGGADVITYRWFLKALDNLTEIQPHIIIVSATDFPRHWKTLFTHIEAGEIENQPLVYLITDESFTESEKKKAMFLGVQDILFSPLTNRDKNSLLSMLPAGMTGTTSSDVQPAETSEPYAYPEAEVPPAVSINDFPAADDIQTNDELVVSSADEDILTRLEDEMTLSEIPAELKNATTPAPAEPAPVRAFNESGEDEVSASLSFDDEPYASQTTEPAPVPEPESAASQRPEQITWSASVDELPQDAPESDEPENNEQVRFSFINPTSGLVVTGSVQSYDHPTIKFAPSARESIAGIRFGQILEQCSFTFEDETIKARAQVRGLGELLEFCLLY